MAGNDVLDPLAPLLGTAETIEQRLVRRIEMWKMRLDTLERTRPTIGVGTGLPSATNVGDAAQWMDAPNRSQYIVSDEEWLYTSIARVESFDATTFTPTVASTYQLMQQQTIYVPSPGWVGWQVDVEIFATTDDTSNLIDGYVGFDVGDGTGIHDAATEWSNYNTWNRVLSSPASTTGGDYFPIGRPTIQQLTPGFHTFKLYGKTTYNGNSFLPQYRAKMRNRRFWVVFL